MAAGSPEPAVAPKFTPRGESERDRILIAVKDERIDFKAMSSESAKRFNELMHLPEVQAQFGIGPLTETFDPRHCKRFYDAFGRIMGTIGRFALKLPPEACEKLLYTDREKDELAEPTAAALNEIAPKWIRENQSVVTFLAVFGAITQAKLQEAIVTAAAINAMKRQNPAAGPIPPAATVRIPIQSVPQAEM